MKKNFAKRIMAVLSTAVMMVGLTACNNKIDITYEYDATQYFEIGQYKGIEISIDRAALEDEVISDKIKEDIETYTEYTEKKTGAQNKDRVTVTYTGSIGGSSVDGFSGKEDVFVLGTDTFLIEGFLDELYDMKTGDSKIVTLTVPEDFTENESYAGKRIVYDIKMDKVEQIIVPMITDAFVKEKFGIETVDDYKETLRKNLSGKVDEKYAAVKKELVLKELSAGAKVNGYPEEFLSKKKEEYNKSIAMYAIMLNMTNDMYCQQYFDCTFDEFVKKSVLQDALIQLVVKKEGLTVTEYEYKDKLESFAAQQGYTDKESFVEKYGKNEIAKSMLFDKAQDFIIDSAVVK